MGTHTEVEAHWEIFRDAQRREISSAIVELINEADGPITIAQIADRAGVSRPTFYKYFATVGAAMLHTHRLVLQELAVHAEGHQPNTGPGLDRLLDAHRVIYELAEHRPDLMRFSSYFDYTFRQNGLTQAEQELLHDLETSQTRLSLPIFEQGQLDGSIRPELNPEPTLFAMGTSLLGTVQRLLVSWDQPQDLHQEPVVLFNTALDAWDRFLRSDEGNSNTP